MNVYIKIAGQWLPSTMAYIKVAGQWIPGSAAYKKVAGVWLPAHGPQPPSTGGAFSHAFSKAFDGGV